MAPDPCREKFSSEDNPGEEWVLEDYASEGSGSEGHEDCDARGTLTNNNDVNGADGADGADSNLEWVSVAALPDDDLIDEWVLPDAAPAIAEVEESALEAVKANTPVESEIAISPEEEDTMTNWSEVKLELLREETRGEVDEDATNEAQGRSEPPCKSVEDETWVEVEGAKIADLPERHEPSVPCETRDCLAGEEQSIIAAPAATSTSLIPVIECAENSTSLVCYNPIVMLQEYIPHCSLQCLREFLA